jgi:hypothetical protein
MAGQSAARRKLPFRTVNSRDARDYNPGLQRHHLLPRQLVGRRCFGAMFDAVGRDRIGFDDFRVNGLLLPASDAAALRMGLPLHRGPHRDYNCLVIERVGQIERGWAGLRLKVPEIALEQASMQLSLLQRALRRRLLEPAGRRLALSRYDPFGKAADYTDLDAMAESLWNAAKTEAAAGS